MTKQEVINLVLSMPDDVDFLIETDVDVNFGDLKVKKKITSSWYAKNVGSQEI